MDTSVFSKLQAKKRPGFRVTRRGLFKVLLLGEAVFAFEYALEIQSSFRGDLQV